MLWACVRPLVHARSAYDSTTLGGECLNSSILLLNCFHPQANKSGWSCGRRAPHSQQHLSSHVFPLSSVIDPVPQADRAAGAGAGRLHMLPHFTHVHFLTFSNTGIDPVLQADRAAGAGAAPQHLLPPLHALHPGAHNTCIPIMFVLPLPLPPLPLSSSLPLLLAPPWRACSISQSCRLRCFCQGLGACTRRFLRQSTSQAPSTHRSHRCLSILPFNSAFHSCLTISQEFNLIDERELAPLKELIDRMVR